MSPWTDIKVAKVYPHVMAFVLILLTVLHTPWTWHHPAVLHLSSICTHPKYRVCPQDTGVRKENEASLVWGYQEIQDTWGHQVRTAHRTVQLHFSIFILTMDHMNVYKGKRVMHGPTARCRVLLSLSSCFFVCRPYCNCSGSISPLFTQHFPATAVSQTVKAVINPLYNTKRADKVSD